MGLEGEAWVVRPMRAEDLEAVVALERACFGDPWPRSCFEAELREAPEIRWPLVAVGPDRLAGYAIAWFVADEVQVANLAVAPAARRRGVGRRLIERILVEAARRGAGAIHLEVRASNRAAQGLYRQVGFEVVGRRKGYYRDGAEDALLMRREVAGEAGEQGATGGPSAEAQAAPPAAGPQAAAARPGRGVSSRRAAVKRPRR